MSGCTIIVFKDTGARYLHWYRKDSELPEAESYLMSHGIEIVFRARESEYNQATTAALRQRAKDWARENGITIEHI